MCTRKPHAVPATTHAEVTPDGLAAAERALLLLLLEHEHRRRGKGLLLDGCLEGHCFEGSASRQADPDPWVRS